MKIQDELKPAALAFEQFSYQAHQLKFARAGTAPAAALAAAPPKPSAEPPNTTDLNDLLNSVNKAPGRTTVVAVPKTTPQSDLELLQHIQLVDSYISILTAYAVYNEHPTPYDITDRTQALEFTKAVAKQRNFVMTGGVVKDLAAYVPIASSVPGGFHKTVTTADLHVELLTSMFAAFGLEAAAMKELDAILTQTATDLKSLNLEFKEQNQTLDHFVTYYYFERVPGTGEGTSIAELHQVKMRLFNMKIDQSSWKVSVSKSSVGQTRQDINWIDIACRMDGGLVAEDAANIRANIHRLMGNDDAAINKIMGTKVIRADPVRPS